jgi:glycine betaine/proline transport system substrate-binding protein
VSANNDWLEANPAAAKLLDLFQMSVIDVSLMNVEMADGTAVLDLAQSWIVDNRAEVDEWLEAARAAA